MALDHRSGPRDRRRSGRLLGALGLLGLVGGCSGNSTPQPPQPPPSVNRTVLVAVQRPDTVGVDHVQVTLDPDFSSPVIGTTNQDGVLTLFVPRTVQGGAWISVRHPGYQDAAVRVTLFPSDQAVDTRFVVPVLPRAPPTPRLIRSGRRLLRDGVPFVWRGVTAFQLLDHYADGRVDEARAFMDWAAATGFTVLRVLTVLQASWFDLPPLQGVQALLPLLDDAAQRGLYVELVALAGTVNWSREDLEAQVTAIGAFAELRSNTLVELANENAHPSQHDDLTEPDYLRSLRARIPAGVPVSLGSNCCGQPDEGETLYPGGDYVTVHLDRSRDDWNLVRRVRELEALSADCACYVVNDEPIGAAEIDQPGRRIADPDIHFTFGALARIFQVGTTFHCEDCLFARVPGPVQQTAAAATIAGTRIVPDTVTLTYKNAGPAWPDSPVAAFTVAGQFGDSHSAIRVYSGVGSTTVTVALGVTGDPGIAWRGNWHPVETLADRGEVIVWRLAP